MILDSIRKPTNLELLAHLHSAREDAREEHEALAGMTEPFDLEDVGQHSDTLATHIAIAERATREAGRRGLIILPWPERETYDACADLCLS